METNTKKLNEKIPKYMKINFNFIIDDYGFKIVDASSSESFGGNEIVILNANGLFIKIVKDRDQYTYYFGTNVDEKEEWYDWDIIENYLKGNKKYLSEDSDDDTSLMYDTKYLLEKAKSELKIINQNFVKILAIFNDENKIATKKILNKYKNQRAKLLYG